jgi:hypothetical protein
MRNTQGGSGNNYQTRQPHFREIRLPTLLQHIIAINHITTIGKEKQALLKEADRLYAMPWWEFTLEELMGQHLDDTWADAWLNPVFQFLMSFNANQGT